MSEWICLRCSIGEVRAVWADHTGFMPYRILAKLSDSPMRSDSGLYDSGHGLRHDARNMRTSLTAHESTAFRAFKHVWRPGESAVVAMAIARRSFVAQLKRK